jgi:class 3 adenylate cyclase
MDVGDWLRKLGLERYEPAFRDNEIDARVLPSLTAEDLKDLGVTLVGHRRRLLDAIAALGAAVPTAPSDDRPAQADAERRQLTVMFCDLVGSTALSARLDPEDLREVIAVYHRAVAEIIAGFDGFVSRYMGATAYWSILATRKRMRTMPSGRCERGWAPSMRLVASMSNPSSSKRASGSPAGW